ncbi:hypothetical protein M2150_000907 [Lachnospiraceae bacterium PM6-15]|uniref:polysaccharide pyruvyl transferase family protein n=1 Tax=Ohessyouella blattaphilus TaxID=2949333 RepID=UPI003E26C262
MIKIGILTYHRSLNYGAVMQAMALSSEIRKRFPEVKVEIVDYSSKRMDRYYKMITIYRGKESLLHIKKRIQMYLAFKRGMKKLPLSEKRIVSDSCIEVEEYIQNKYDIIISGSDAVWNYRKRGLPNPYFLTGAGTSYRMSYGASCNGLGINRFDDIPVDQQAYLKKAFYGFDYIGVRDEQTATLVHKISPDIPTYHNCDPSLLLEDLSQSNRDELIAKLIRKYKFDPDKPTIGLMMSNLNGGFREELAKRLKERYGDKYQTVSIYSYNKYADIPYIADLTPQEWSLIFGLFKLTISKYFHGSMFSLLNRTPVIAVSAEENIGELPDKIEDALDRLELSDMYFTTSDSQSIDWNTLLNKTDEFLDEKAAKTIKERIDRGIKNEVRSAESFFDNLTKAVIKQHN